MFVSDFEKQFQQQLTDELKRKFARISDRDLSMLIMNAVNHLGMIHEGDKEYTIEQLKKDIVIIIEFEGHLISGLREIKEPFK